jgi:hypothetical protein
MAHASAGLWRTHGLTQRLIELHEDQQLTFTEIALTLSKESNRHVSRNACIGKSHRLMLSKRDRSTAARNNNARRRLQKLASQGLAS